MTGTKWPPEWNWGNSKEADTSTRDRSEQKKQRKERKGKKEKGVVKRNEERGYERSGESTSSSMLFFYQSCI
jgi:hypothetical protein